MAYKVLFLDVDGVLHAADAKHRPFRQPCMEVLKTILEESPCHVVLSSNWRFDSWGLNKVNARLEQIGADAIIDTTHLAEDHFNTRADEILDWLHRHPEATHFVVLDDVDLCYDDPTASCPECISVHLIQTDETKGLQPDDARRARACLEIPIDRAKLVRARLLEEAEAAAAEAASFDALEVLSTPATPHALDAHAVTACPPLEREGCEAATADRAAAEVPTLVPLTAEEQQLAEALVSNLIIGAQKSNASSPAGSRGDSRTGSRRISRRASTEQIDHCVRQLSMAA